MRLIGHLFSGRYAEMLMHVDEMGPRSYNIISHALALQASVCVCVGVDRISFEDMCSSWQSTHICNCAALHVQRL